MSFLYLANEVRGVIRGIGQLEGTAVKVASADSSEELQGIIAEASSRVYDELLKEADARVSLNSPRHFKVPALVEKMANALHQPSMDTGTRLKLAAIVHADNVLTDCMTDAQNDTELYKLAELRSYGREYFVNVLQKVL